MIIIFYYSCIIHGKLAHNWYDLHSESTIHMVHDSGFSCTVPNWNSSLLHQQEKNTHLWSWHFLVCLLKAEKVTNQKIYIFILRVHSYYINVREYRKGNQKWTNQRIWQHKGHKMKTICVWTPLCTNNHTIRKYDTSPLVNNWR